MGKTMIDGIELAKINLGKFSFHEFSTLSELHYVLQDSSHAKYDLELVLRSQGRRMGDYSLKILFVDVSGLDLKSLDDGLSHITGLAIENISDRQWENQNWEIHDFEDSRIEFRAADVRILSVTPLTSRPPANRTA
jgi:hypothetical protein